MQRLRNFAESLAIWGERLSVLFVLVLVSISCIDVLGAKLFNMPVKGATEVISMVQLVMIACIIGSTQLNKGHVSVDMFVLKMPPRARVVVGCLVSALSLLLFSVLFWQTTLLGMAYHDSGEVTATALIPFYPFAFILSLTMFPCILVSICDFVQYFKESI